jgi:hypothetical protein
MSKLKSAVVALWNHIDPKVRAPFLTAVVATLVQWVSTGVFDAAEIATTGTAVIVAIVGYLVPNEASLIRGAVPDEPNDVPDAPTV